MILTLLEAAILAAALSLDAFVACFAYGSNNIKIPISSVQVITYICSSVIGISLLAGSFVRQFIPAWITTAICFTILLILGLVKLLDSLTKSLIRKYNSLNHQIHFSMLNFRFVLSLYADPEKADLDQSKTLSPKESVSLALALSLDGLAAGFGAALGSLNVVAVFLFSLVIGALAVILGAYAGKKLVKTLPCNISWISGAILIVLAFSKLF